MFDCFEPLNAIFVCKACNFTCETSVELKTHKSQSCYSPLNVKIQLRKCNNCKFQTTSELLFSLHLEACTVPLGANNDILHNIGSYYYCPKCDYKTLLKNFLDAHFEVIHKDAELGTRHLSELLTCRKCQLKCIDETQFSQHKCIQAETLSHRCNFCSFKAGNMTILVNHLKTHVHTTNLGLKFDSVQKGAPEVPIIEIADSLQGDSVKTNKRSPGFEISAAGASPECSKGDKVPDAIPEWFYCNDCNYKGTTKYSIRLHIAVKHRKANLYNCGECSYSALKPEYIKVHYNIQHATDEEAKWFCCDYCPFKTRRPSYITPHMKRKHAEIIHNQPELAKKLKLTWLLCDFCDFKTYKDSLLQHHLNASHASEVKDKWFYCELCTFKGRNKCGLTNHINAIHQSERQVVVIKCQFCEYVTSTQQQLKFHVNVKHATGDDIVWYDCKYCSYKAKTRWYVTKHARRKHIEDLSKDGLQVLDCELCDFKTDKKVLLQNHLNTRHEAKVEVKWYCCPHCPFKGKTNWALEKHIVIKHQQDQQEEEVLKCPHCEYETTKRSVLKSHINVKHATGDDIVWSHCKYCSFKAKTRGYVSKHMQREHIGEMSKDGFNVFECDLCDFKTHNRVFLVNHTNGAHDDVREIQWYACEDCDYKGKSSVSYQKHVQIYHKNRRKRTIFKPKAEPKYYCDYCPFKARKHSYITPHMKRDHIELIFNQPNAAKKLKITWLLCDFCDFKTYKERLLQNHLNTSHASRVEIKWFCCQHCTFKGKTHWALEKHINIKHQMTKQEIVKCPHCEYETSKQGSLKVHVNVTHATGTDIVWYHCKYCSFKAKTSGYVTKHMQREHIAELSKDGLDVFECDLCDFKSHNKVLLVNHTNVAHDDVREIQWFTCADCDYKGRSSYSVQKHVQIYHKERRKRTVFKAKKAKAT